MDSENWPFFTTHPEALPWKQEKIRISGSLIDRNSKERLKTLFWKIMRKIENLWKYQNFIVPFLSRSNDRKPKRRHRHGAHHPKVQQKSRNHHWRWPWIRLLPDQRCTYFIKGTAIVYKNNKEIKTLYKGDSFGEQSLFYNTQRQITIRAEEDVVCLVLGRDQLNQVLMDQVRSLFRLMMSRLETSKCKL